MRCELKQCSWTRLSHGSVDSAVDYFLDLLMSICKKYIPTAVIEEEKQTHPWLDENCQNAIRAIMAATDTDAFDIACDRCAEVLNASYKKYVEKSQNTNRQIE